MQAVFVEIDRLFIKYIWKCKELSITKTILKENKVGELMLTDFTTYYPTTVNKPVCCWSKNRPGVLSLSTIDILGPFILYCGGLSCGLYPIDAPSCDNHKCLQTRPNVPRGGKIAPVENFWDRHINQ